MKFPPFYFPSWTPNSSLKQDTVDKRQLFITNVTGQASPDDGIFKYWNMME